MDGSTKKMAEPNTLPAAGSANKPSQDKSPSGVNSNTPQGAGQNEDPRLNCVDCGKPYYLTTGEISFYKSKGMPLPKRCQPCRHERRATINAEKRYEAPKW